MQFDLFTLVWACSLVVFLSGAMLAYFWTRAMRYPWLAMWAVAFVLMSLGIVVTMAKPGDPGPLMSAAGNSLFILSFGFVWNALRLFERRKAFVWSLPIPPLLWSAAVFVPAIYDSLAARVIIISVMLSAYCGLSALELWRGRDEPLASKKPFMFLVLLIMAFYAGRVFLVDLVPYPYGAGDVDQLVSAVMAAVIVAASLAATILLLAMTLERKEMAQRELATLDPLTGFYNRRGLDAVLPDQKLPAGCALILFDLDRFKQVNDNFGHASGDALISGFAQICREELRQVDHAVRLGGEEFVIILIGADEHAAVATAERVRTRYGQSVFTIANGALAGTVSGGVFCAPAGEAVWLTAATAAADRALYRAKTTGRDRIFVAGAEAGAEPTSREFDERCVASKAQPASA